MKPVTSNKRDYTPSTAMTAVAAEVILMVAKARLQRHLTPFSHLETEGWPFGWDFSLRVLSWR